MNLAHSAWISAVLLVAAAAAPGCSRSSQHAGAEDRAAAESTPAATTKAPTVGDAAPGFKLRGSDGKTYTLADFADRMVVLEWFNKDCPTCIRQSDVIKATATALAKKGVAWLAIDSSHYRKAAENTAYANEHKLPYPILEDFDGRVGKSYGVLVTPHLFVIRKGRIEYSGAILRVAEERNYVQEAVDALLAGDTPPLPTTRAYG